MRQHQGATWGWTAGEDHPGTQRLCCGQFPMLWKPSKIFYLDIIISILWIMSTKTFSTKIYFLLKHLLWLEHTIRSPQQILSVQYIIVDHRHNIIDQNSQAYSLNWNFMIANQYLIFQQPLVTTIQCLIWWICLF